VLFFLRAYFCHGYLVNWWAMPALLDARFIYSPKSVDSNVDASSPHHDSAYIPALTSR
jgi:hypothetical protein